MKSSRSGDLFGIPDWIYVIAGSSLEQVSLIE